MRTSTTSKLTTDARSFRKPVRVPQPPRPTLSSDATPTETELLLVPFRSGEAVHRHPDLATKLADGWTIRRAEPRVVEGQGTCLLVVLAR